ncbi:uncharacterized protein BO88DRAFT_379115 [Aspergillus vadensis CBS 113365]|uniref:Uncharacterized protein n=1 Tax=Aspergillus vadensis (strain CBS 113365 / IMI 142717 / IBT 24658) TaxID=1448311 RepID=A0A319BRU9_ASPVC|nr:hypothetical protein BO88DRAFT_379115 [Aspergillus vadensis CBS 113365]PYH75161.1 hypothetical protein BO88DRAFT_379115 [Aspergillus vadensis CBS 113365]
MQAELKQEIEAKTRAVNRALDEWKENGGSRGDVDRSLVELFNVGRPTNNRHIVQYFASLLRPNDADDLSPSPSMPSTSYHNEFMPSPERSSSMVRDGVKDTTAVTESSRLNSLQPSPAETDVLNMTISPSHLAAIFPEDFFGGMPNNDLDLVPQGFVPQGLQFQDLGTMMDTAESMGANTGLNTFVPEDDHLFVPQLTPQSGLNMNLDLHSHASSGSWEEWLAGSNTMTRPEMPTGLETPVASVNNTHSQGLNGPTSATRDLRDGSEVRELSADLSTSGPSTSTRLAAYLDDIALDLQNGVARSQTLNQISPSDIFKTTWSTFDGGFIQTLLRELICSDKAVGAATVNYFARKLTAVQTTPETWTGRWVELKELRQCPQRLLVMVDDPDYSLVEIQCQADSLTHYIGGSATSPEDNDHCGICHEIEEHVTQLLYLERRRTPQWNIQHQAIPTELADGSWLLWVTRRRTKWMDAQDPVPADYRLRLAGEVLHDFKAAQSSNGLLRLGMPGNLPTPDGTTGSLETFWKDFGEHHGFRTTVWDTVREIAARKDSNQMPIGMDRASELMQLAMNIGSPDVLISLQDCLRHIRQQLASRCPDLSETPWGTFDAYCLHQKSQTLSTIGLRLASWKLQKLKKDHSGSNEIVADLILSEKPLHRSVSREEILSILKDKKAIYWCHLVEHVGNNDPNILCLLPRVVNIGPPRWHRKLNATSYRDLSLRECKILGELYTDLRSDVLRTACDELSTDLLYIKDPGAFYRVEKLSPEQISREPLTSDFYIGILQKVPG